MKYILILVFSLFLGSFLYAQDSISVKKEVAVSFLIIEDVPVFPGCKGDNITLKKCFSKGVMMHFIKNFDADLPNNLGLKAGKIKVFLGFSINKEGVVENILVRSPQPKLSFESERVMNLLPKMVPGKIRGKNVAVKYVIPFTIIVEETRKQRKARRRREKKLRRAKRKI